MANDIADVIRTLRSERALARKHVKKLEKAIAVLRGLSTNSTPRNGRRRRMSASARRKIAAAQRKRWAKVRSAKG